MNALLDLAANISSDGFVYANYVTSHDDETERFASMQLSMRVMAVRLALDCEPV